MTAARMAAARIDAHDTNAMVPLDMVPSLLVALVVSVDGMIFIVFSDN